MTPPGPSGVKWRKENSNAFSSLITQYTDANCSPSIGLFPLARTPCIRGKCSINLFFSRIVECFGLVLYVLWHTEATNSKFYAHSNLQRVHCIRGTASTAVFLSIACVCFFPSTSLPFLFSFLTLPPNFFCLL